MSAPIRLSDERGQYESAILARYAEARQRLTRPRPKPVTTVDDPPPATVNSPYGSMVNLCAGPSWKVIVGLVALQYSVSVNDILGQDRRPDVIKARQKSVALCHSHCNLSLPALGRLFHRDHSTILHSVRRYYGRPIRSLREEYIRPNNLQPLDMLAAPSWRFIVRLIAFRRGVPVDQVLLPGCRSRRQAREMITTHCNCSPVAAGALLSTWGVQ